MTTPPAYASRRAWRWLIPLAAAALILAIPHPDGLQPHGWHYFAAFIAVIIGLVLEPLPSAAIGLIGVVTVAALGLVFTPAERALPGFNLPGEAMRWALGGFANSTVWLIFAAFMFSMGYEKTGLGRRLALVLVKQLGARTLGLGYAIVLADLILAPFTPSNTARSGGTIYPIVRNIPALYGSQPGATARKVGSYLMWVAFAATCVTSSMFVTALAPNLLAVDLARSIGQVNISWTDWLVGFLPVGGLLLLLLPWLVYQLYPPEIARSDRVPEWAARELAAMGQITRGEWVMAALVIAALLLWILGGAVANPSLVALAAICVMVLTRVVEWDDILAHRQAWNVLVWFATLVVLADGLRHVGIIEWVAREALDRLAVFPPLAVLAGLVTLFFLVHYLFASLTAHTTAVLPVLLAAGAIIPGMPVKTLALLLGFTLGLMGIITPYATGPAPVYFGSGYISRPDFWRLGFVFGGIFLAAILLLGIPWLLVLD